MGKQNEFDRGLTVTKRDFSFMRRAIELSLKNVKKGRGPFGAIITRKGEILAEGCNLVTALNDPTAHAEINVIREAAKKLKTFDLSDCTLYSSCEPCPMCLGAIYWARIAKVFFATTTSDAESIGFKDAQIYEEISLPLQERSIEFKQILREEALEAFKVWKESEKKEEY
jgi:tRNA(Arg) A34 adenosine deaminase TadA